MCSITNAEVSLNAFSVRENLDETIGMQKSSYFDHHYDKNAKSSRYAKTAFLH